MYNNTVSKRPTHIICGVPLIQKAMEDTGVPSENWAYPTEHRLGDPVHDDYYAEIWTNGMDWQVVYWLLEQRNLDNPVAIPLITFDDYKDREAFPDFDEFLIALIWERRRSSRKDDNNWGIYWDSVWPFFQIQLDRTQHTNATKPGEPFWVGAKFEHAGGRSEFYVHRTVAEMAVVYRAAQDEAVKRHKQKYPDEMDMKAETEFPKTRMP